MVIKHDIKANRCCGKISVVKNRLKFPDDFLDEFHRPSGPVHDPFGSRGNHLRSWVAPRQKDFWTARASRRYPAGAEAVTELQL